MKNLLHSTKGLFKKIKKMHADLQKGAKREKFEMPETALVSSPEKEEARQKVDISASSVAKATLVVIGILLLSYGVYEVKSLLFLFFISLFFASALDPIIDWFESKRIPRGVSVIIVYILLLAIFIALLGSMIPAIIQQIADLITWLSEVVVNFFQNLQENPVLNYIPEKYSDWIVSTIKSVNIEMILKQVLANFSTILDQFKEFATGSFKQIGSAVGAVGGITASIANAMFNISMVLILTFFMVVDRNSLHDFFLSLFPKKNAVYISEKIHEIQLQIGAWFRGQLLLSLIMFILTFLGMLFVGMGDYALTLAFIMAIGEFIPYIGPMIFVIFGLPIALGKGLMVTIYFLIFYALLQFFEGNIIVPAVMNKAVGLSPIVVILVLIIGFQFLGVMGAIMAVPLTTAVAIFVTDYTKAMKNKK
jgi:predicted PurR-regulated permease PerM